MVMVMSWSLDEKNLFLRVVAPSGYHAPGGEPSRSPRAPSKKPNTIRRPESALPLIAASECLCEKWICEISWHVVTPASSWESEPNSSLIYTSSGWYTPATVPRMDWKKL